MCGRERGVRFFFSSGRRHTRLVSDWSSDVCSSDLDTRKEVYAEIAGGGWAQDRYVNKFAIRTPNAEQCAEFYREVFELEPVQIGRASCRERAAGAGRAGCRSEAEAGRHTAGCVRRCVVASEGCGFFFQAEDGIRGWSVTGVQTCALPIWTRARKSMLRSQAAAGPRTATSTNSPSARPTRNSARNSIARCSSSNRCRSEERRVGKEQRVRGVRVVAARQRRAGTRQGAYGDVWSRARGAVFFFKRKTAYEVGQ